MKRVELGASQRPGLQLPLLQGLIAKMMQQHRMHYPYAPCLIVVPPIAGAGMWLPGLTWIRSQRQQTFHCTSQQLHVGLGSALSSSHHVHAELGILAHQLPGCP